MNSLSWFLYLADIVSNLAVVLGIMGFVLTLIGASCYAVVLTIGNADEVKKYNLFWGKMAAIGFLALVMFAFLPGKTTVYAIAASEMGEKAVNSEIGQKTMKAIDAWITSQLPKEK